MISSGLTRSTATVGNLANEASPWDSARMSLINSSTKTNYVHSCNNSELLIRSHEVKNDGYEKTHADRVITIFSAPNYCDFTGNKAAFIRLDGKTMTPKFTQFDAVVLIIVIVASS